MYHIPSKLRMKKNNYRRFPDSLPQAFGIGSLVLSLSFTVALGVLLFNLVTVYKQGIMYKDSAHKELAYWQNIVKKYPHFPAAYYEVALYSAQLENKEKARESLQKALLIDPNFFQAEVLANELEKK